MKVFWKLKDDFDECPICACTFVSFDGINQLCPSCAAREIKRLRKLVARLTQRVPDLGQAVARDDNQGDAPSG